MTERLILSRKDAGISQTKLAREIGVTPQAVQNWEKGKSLPKRTRIEKIAKALSVTEEWLSIGSVGASTEEHNKYVSEKLSSALEKLSADEKERTLFWIKKRLISTSD